ncbi:MAG: hypothetical protein ACK58L_08250 [Planctomycetota bacterium]
MNMFFAAHVIRRSMIVFFVGPTLVFSMLHASDRGPRVARVLWQDHQKDALMWGEVHGGDKWVVSASPVASFPKLDNEKQDLVQMEQAEGVLLVGVRDNDDGKFQSGWVAVDTGVREQPHGDHSHWNFVTTPTVKGSRLDSEQGNPAHLYLYNSLFYMANDRRNGFSQIAPKDLMTRPAANCGVFFPGGGNHITLAAVDNSVAYSSWIDGDGPNAGRVDVVNLKKPPAEAMAYSFQLPTGVIHGATANSGRVFFAPADGICWVDADTTCSKTAESVVVNHISLGREEGEEKSNRTGAFVNHRNFVLFTTGGPAGKSSLCVLDAKAAQPSVVKVSIDVAEGLSLTTPEVVLASGGKRYAFLFHDKKDPAAEIEEKLTIVDLDPNGDRNLSDARIAKTMPVGKSNVEGHSGHHSVSFCSEGRIACFTNPGDGTIWVMTLRDLAIRAKSIVGGTPTSIVAIGAPEHKH